MVCSRSSRNSGFAAARGARLSFAKFMTERKMKRKIPIENLNLSQQEVITVLFNRKLMERLIIKRSEGFSSKTRA
jgi:hypothetical protein